MMETKLDDWLASFSNISRRPTDKAIGARYDITQPLRKTATNFRSERKRRALSRVIIKLQITSHSLVLWTMLEICRISDVSAWLKR